MKLSALIATVAAQYNPDPTEPAPVPTDPPAPAPVPVESFACFPGNEITPCGCQWNTLESLANKTCTVSFDNDGSVLQFQSHGTWTEGGRSSGDFVFYGVDGMSSDLLNMNWFFNDAECWNPDMPPKYDENGDVVGYYYNRTMDPAPAGWKPSLSCVDNGGVTPDNLFSAFNSNWRPQGNYNVQVITAEGLAAGTFSFNAGVNVANATVDGAEGSASASGNVVAANFRTENIGNSQTINAVVTEGVPDAFGCSFSG